MSSAVPSDPLPPDEPTDGSARPDDALDAPMVPSPLYNPVPTPSEAAIPAGDAASEFNGEPDDAVNPAESPGGLEVPPAPPQIAGPSMLDQPKVATGVGIAASILVHLSIITAGVLLIPQVRQIVAGKTVAEQTIVPTAELATEQVGGIPNPGMTSDKSRAAAQNVDPSVTQSDAWAQQRSGSLDKQLLSGSGEAPPTQIGIGGGKSMGRGLGNGVAGGGGLAKFGVPGGGSGIGPRGAVFGNGGNAYRIVFVCDGTGGMFDGRKLPLLLRELQNTIAKLKPKQSYDVIFFREGDRPVNESVVAVDKTQLLPAVPVNTEKTRTFLSKLIVSGKTKPIPAIELAFRLKPQLVYFLSDGAFDDLDTYDEVVARFRELNKDKSVRVNTIVFGKNDDTSEALKQAKDTMKKIATDNGGNFLAVDPDAVFGQG